MTAKYTHAHSGMMAGNYGRFLPAHGKYKDKSSTSGITVSTAEGGANRRRRIIAFLFVPERSAFLIGQKRTTSLSAITGVIRDDYWDYCKGKKSDDGISMRRAGLFPFIRSWTRLIDRKAHKSNQ